MLLSIIIPVYNVENYLRECLDSVLGQTYKNIEVIAVNDGSTDGSLEILKEYQKKDKRLVVIDQQNAGAGAARNAALKVMTGDLVGFLDSDDYLLADAYEKLVSLIEKEDVDIAGCNLADLYTDKIIMHDKTGVEVFGREEFLKKTCEEYKYYLMCNKVFKRELLSSEYFPVGNAIDDEFFTFKILTKAKKVAVLGEDLYIYRQRKTSVMHDKEKKFKRLENMLEILKLKNDFYKRNFKNVLPYHQVRLIDRFISVAVVFKEDKLKVKELAKYLRKNCKKTILTKYKLKESLWITLFTLFPNKMIKNMKEEQEIMQSNCFD